MALTREQSVMWEAMGIGPQWILRGSTDPLLSDDAKPKQKDAQPALRAIPKTSPMPSATPAPTQAPAGSVQAVPAARNVREVASPERRPAPRTPAPARTPVRVQSTRTAPVVEADRALCEAVKTAAWEDIASIVARCEACPMSKTRTQTVCADGAPGCPIVIVGEAPGRDEDMQGIPFVGKSGQLLTTILAAAGLERGKDVAIVNVLKCRPQNNRDPLPEETQACRAFLDRQLELLAPKVLLLMGRHAMAGLLPQLAGTAIGRVRGQVHTVTIGDRQIPAIVTYHPSYLLRNLVEKEKSWHDVVRAARLLKGQAH